MNSGALESEFRNSLVSMTGPPYNLGEMLHTFQTIFLINSTCFDLIIMSYGPLASVTVWIAFYLVHMLSGTSRHFSVPASKHTYGSWSCVTEPYSTLSCIGIGWILIVHV